MKIGIITHYYKSKNYGGNLQAYALQRYLSKEYEVEQICYQSSNIKVQSKKELLKELGIWAFGKKAAKHIFNKLKSIVYPSNKQVEVLLIKRERVLLEFNQQIPHSDICYNEETIKEAEEQYDCFITGSDQVWHPSAVNEAYLLNFIKVKPKISYAASLAVSELTLPYQKRMKNALKDYQAISVREENAIALLQDLVGQSIEWVLDPVFLLDKEEWSEVAIENSIKEKYLFCHFLGTDKKTRKLAKAYAKKKNLKIVTIPYLSGKYQISDKNLGDIHLYDINPFGFISLIKNAEYVFTDSFHALAFSRIFEKQYMVFNRNGETSMNSRIYSICELFEEEAHFCDSNKKMCLDYVINQKPIDYTKEFEKFKKKKIQSIEFLRNTLKGVNSIINDQGDKSIKSGRDSFL